MEHDRSGVRSPEKDCFAHREDHALLTYKMTPGFKPFTINYDTLIRGSNKE